jgi:hypothetical protein
MKTISVKKFLSEQFDKLLILDVRSNDFLGGNIPFAHNIPSINYKLISQYVKPYDNIIVHCMYSSLRGPGVVKRLEIDYPNKNIMLLEGGFHKYFNEIFNQINQINKNDKCMISNINLDYWKYNPNTQLYYHIDG